MSPPAQVMGKGGGRMKSDVKNMAGLNVSSSDLVLVKHVLILQ
jgi:hypothetical protein